MTTQTTTTANKTVLILVRYEHKASGSIYCKVRNGENKEYCVALHKSGNTTCTCKHGQTAGNHAHCYHVQHCQAKEQARKAQEATPVVAQAEQIVASYSTPEQRRNAPLNDNNRTFSLMR